MPGRTMIVVAGYWSTNIGNAFFQLGAHHLLRKAFPNDRIVMLSDQPGYWNVKRGNPANALDYLACVEMDYLVILGPYLRPEYPAIWAQTLRKLAARGVRTVVLSAGLMGYSQRAIQSARAWLSEIRPFVFVTRDRVTYDNLADLATQSYDGVDVAVFVSDLHEPVPARLPPYVVFNFDQIPEPRLTPLASHGRAGHGEAVVLDGHTYRVEFPAIELALSRRFKVFPFMHSLLPHRRTHPASLGDKLIVRTDHRFNPMLLRKSYAHPNAFVSDIPYTYLNLYANADATFSDRVHACVATLAYGKPARLFSTTPRAYLLDRLGATRIRQELSTVDPGWLLDEKEAMVQFLRGAVQSWC